MRSAPAIKPYLEFMFMDDRTLAQIAPSGDFGNTLTDQLRQPADVRRSSCAAICDAGQPDQRLPRQLPARGWRSVTTTPGNGARTWSTPIDFFDPRGNTYNQAFFQLLRRNTEGGPRIADLTHTSYRGVLGTRGDLATSSRTTPTSSMAGPTTRRSTRTSSRSRA